MTGETTAASVIRNANPHSSDCGDAPDVLRLGARCENPTVLDSRECVNNTCPGFRVDCAALGERLA